MSRKTWEPLINSGRVDLRVKITRFETRIAGNSPAIAKIRNAEAGDFGLRAAGHELIRGSLGPMPLADVGYDSVHMEITANSYWYSDNPSLLEYLTAPTQISRQ